MRKQNNSKLLGPITLVGIVFPILAGGLLAINYIGYPHTLSPAISYALLLLGLLLASAAQRLTADNWEGVVEVLHIRLAYAGITFLGCALRYSMAGRSLQTYATELLLIISGVFVVSRLMLKYNPKLRTMLQKGR